MMVGCPGTPWVKRLPPESADRRITFGANVLEIRKLGRRHESIDRYTHLDADATGVP